MDKIPVNIISGFLGSGKTTAIIKLLGQKTAGDNWAVIINEFGKISIDSQTLRSSSQAGTVFAISGGCICCSAKGYFQQNLETIVGFRNYTRILIEPSGLGGIDMISEIVDQNPLLRLMPILCLVDITGLENLRLQLNPIYRMQISKANTIVFSKCDLVIDETEQTRLVEKFKSAFPDKKNFLNRTDDNFISYQSGRNNQVNPEEYKFRMILPTNLNLTDSNYQEENCIFSSEAIFDKDRLARFFNDHQQIIRGKGHIRTEMGWNLVNFTMSGCIFEPCQAKEQNEIILITEKSEPNLLLNLKDAIGKAILPKLLKSRNF